MNMEEETFQPIKGCLLSARIEQRLRREERRMMLKLAEEMITPAPMDEADRLVYQEWVKSMGGTAELAAILLSDQDVCPGFLAPRAAHKKVFKLAKHIRSDKADLDADVRTVHDMVLGIKRAPVEEIVEFDWRMKLRASVEQDDVRRQREDRLGLHLQVDWEQINGYTVPNADRNHPLFKRYMGKRQVRGSWVPNLTIRVLRDGELSNDYVAISDFGPWSLLSDNRLIKEFTRRWYQDCGRLTMAMVPVSKDKARIGAYMLLPKEWRATKRVSRFLLGREEAQLVLCCPMSVPSAEKHNRQDQPKLKYRKSVLSKGQRWITTKKVGPMLLAVTCWLCKEQGREGYAVVPLAKTEMTPYEWGARKKELLRDGWTESSHPA